MTYWAVAEHGQWRSYKDKVTSVTAGLGSSFQDRLEPDGLTHAVRCPGWLMDRPHRWQDAFRDYVEDVWSPSRHLEVSTKAGYRANLDRHFLPYFGDMAIADILPSIVQAWVTHAAIGGLSARSIVKYHVMRHSVFKLAVRDRAPRWKTRR